MGSASGRGALRLEQAHHRRVPRRRVAAARDSRACSHERDRRRRHRPPANGRVGADGRVVDRPHRRPDCGCRHLEAVSVLPRLRTRGRARDARRGVRLASRVEVGRHPRPARATRRPDLSLVAGRGARHRSLPRDRRHRGLVARWDRARRGDPAVEGWRATPVRSAAAAHRPQDVRRENPQRSPGGARRLRPARAGRA